MNCEPEIRARSGRLVHNEPSYSSTPQTHIQLPAVTAPGFVVNFLSLRPFTCLCIICRRRDTPAVAGPVRMKELTTRLIDSLVGVRAKEVALSL
jgi:hypothetical protein